MKHFTIYLMAVITMMTIANGCSKKDSAANTCKTCRALGGPDAQTISKQVCTTAEEQAFRQANAGKEITCGQ
jgi:hypothetical protein